MIQYLEKVKMLTGSFKKFSIKQVLRSENKKADALSKIASTSFAHLSKQVLVEVRKEKSINEAEVLTVVGEEGNTWMTLIYEYLTKKTLPVKKKKARAVRLKSRRYAIINGVMYKKSFLEQWLRCVRPLQANYVMREIHEGSCSMYAGPRSLGERMKARLDKGSKDWMEEILHVLWVHHTMIKSSNWDTSFSLTYETEAVVPAKIGMPTLRTTEIDMVQNDEALKLNLDLLEEKREQAAIHEARSKAKIENYYKSKVCYTSFKPGDLVYRSNDASHAEDRGKLGPKWKDHMKHGRKYFRHRNNRKLGENKISTEGETSGISRGDKDRAEGPMILEVEIGGGILILRSSNIIPLECTMVSGPNAQPSAITRATEEKIKVGIHPEYPEQTIAIGSTLTKEGRKKLCNLLRRNLGIFAWKPATMTGVSRHLVKHRLNVREGCPPVRQRKRSQALERNKAIQRK
uniref:Reverse transcriptase domain-containing protein n=1 Tax=Tanacetum cinerariifolium TaxID=118510 RepID=A0A6L2MKL1_TANCI|nr:reverse transcriptase domain-containing protein [Tanacetum cinerariifolium]